MKKTILLLFAISLVACTNGNIPDKSKKDKDSVKVEQHKELSAEDVYKQASDKVAMVLCYKDGLPYSQGSGFFIDANTLITNYHVVEGSNKIELKLAGKEDVFKGAKVIKAAPDYDLAIIQTNQQFPYLPIDSTFNDKVGSKIYTIGNPRGLEGTISEGILSGVRNDEDVDYLQITAPISPGNSGGPVINKMGKVIGISTFSFKNSQNLNFAMPIKYISKCVAFSDIKPKKEKHNYGINPKAVIVSDYHCPSIGDARVSLKNNTSQDVFNIYGILVYKTMGGEVFDFDEIFYEDVIPSGLAKSILGYKPSGNCIYHKSVEVYDRGYNDVTIFKVEFRLISYEIDE